MGRKIKLPFLAASVAAAYLFLALVSPVQAKVEAFIAEGNDKELYEYEYKALVESYALSLIGAPAPLYVDYSQKKVELLLDDVNAYVDYKDVLEAYTKSLLAGKTFDLDAYTSGTNAKVVAVDKVHVVSVENGKLKLTEKILGDPEAAALEEVNGASDATALRDILEARAGILGLDLTNYTKLFENGRLAVAAGMLQRRGSGFTDASALRAAFSEEVQRILADVGHLLDTINSAASIDELEALLLEHGLALDLPMHSYAMVISSRKGQVVSAVSAQAPFQTVAALRMAFNSAIASVLNSYVVVSFSDYNRTLQEMVDIQMPLKPQWQVSGQGWRDAPREQVEYYLNPDNFILGDLAATVAEIIVTADVLNVRDIPSTTGTKVASVQKGSIYSVLEAVEVTQDTAPGTEGYWFKITVGSNTGWVSGLFADWVAASYTPQMFQFLTLSGSSGITVAELANILQGRGILSGMEAVFHEASRENNINEIFLTSMALHESGNGTSQLANGILFTPSDPSLEPRVVYNMYGIGAVDSNPNYKGAEYAYKQGWFSPEEAIRGGAAFVARDYVNHASYRQNTLYKIRWNPGNPGKHQYATDIGWAVKQTSFIRQLYNQISIYSLKFDVPRYKK